MKTIALEEHFSLPGSPSVALGPYMAEVGGSWRTSATGGSPTWTLRASTCRCCPSRPSTRPQAPRVRAIARERQTTRWPRRCGGDRSVSPASPRSRCRIRKERPPSSIALSQRSAWRAPLSTGPPKAAFSTIRASSPCWRRRSASESRSISPCAAPRARVQSLLQRPARVRRPLALDLRLRLACRNGPPLAQADRRRRLRPLPRPAGHHRPHGGVHPLLPRALRLAAQPDGAPPPARRRRLFSPEFPHHDERILHPAALPMRAFGLRPGAHPLRRGLSLQPERRGQELPGTPWPSTGATWRKLPTATRSLC